MRASRALRIERQRLAFERFGADQHLFDRRLRRGREIRTLRAGQQSGVEFETRIFGRGADERDGAVLHDGQETVLLRAVEAMDLIDEKQRALPVARRRSRRVEDFLSARRRR